MSTVKVNAITDASGGNTATINSMTPTADSLQGFRNRIINGDMRIDQRNAGASVTVNDNAAFFGVDRFRSMGQATDGVFTVQQSSTAPTGFVNSMLVTVTTADASIGSTQRYRTMQRIEGLNTADWMWGTANAKTVTLSFWVRSSLTGTFGGSIINQNGTRSYPFSYTISVSNTWEYKTVTIAGDTTGTWLTTNDVGVSIIWSFGMGSSFQGTANSWQAGDYETITGETQLIGTLNATWYITGVQLEVGSVATPFERRPYGTELMLCQRYFESSMTVAPADSMTVASTGVYWLASSGATPTLSFPFKTTKRDSATMTYYSPLTTSPSGKVREDATGTVRNVTGGAATAWGAIIGVTSGTASVAYQFGYWASSEL